MDSDKCEHGFAWYDDGCEKCSMKRDRISSLNRCDMYDLDIGGYLEMTAALYCHECVALWPFDAPLCDGCREKEEDHE